MGVATAIAAGAAIAGVGMSVAQAAKQNKLQKQAARKAEIARKNAMNLTVNNPYKGVQTPTLANKLASEEINQAGSNAVQALQGTGAEGVLGGVSEVNRGIQNSQLDIATNQNENQFRRDVAEAEAQTNINNRQVQIQYDTEVARYNQENQNRVDAQYNKNQAIMNAFGSATQAVNSLSNTDVGVYGTKGATKQSLKALMAKGYNKEEAQQIINSGQDINQF